MNFKKNMIMLAAAALMGTSGVALAHDVIKQVNQAATPSLSPDGKIVLFSWRGELWSSDVAGGLAKRLTMTPGLDGFGHYSPDGKTIYFSSARKGSMGLYEMPAAGGHARQIGFHSEGYFPLDVSRDGKTLLVRAVRDAGQPRTDERLLEIHLGERQAERELFDTAANYGALSPDGTKVLFQREGSERFRKGYYGSQAGQIWMMDKLTGQFRCLIKKADQYNARYPVWAPDGKSFYFVNETPAGFSIASSDLEGGPIKTLSIPVKDVIYGLKGCAKKDVLLCQRLGGLWLLDPSDENLHKIEIKVQTDLEDKDELRIKIGKAEELAFSPDLLEVAFISMGDLYVMDTVLREPVAVSAGAELDQSPLFANDLSAIYFTRQKDSSFELCKAVRADSSKAYWQNEQFTISVLTKSELSFSRLDWMPDGKRLHYTRGDGSVWTIKPDGTDPKLLIDTWSAPDYSFSPDGKWLAWATLSDQNDNEVYIAPVDGSLKPINLSLHPGHDYSPAWSPDGKRLAYVSGRFDGEASDVVILELQRENFETTARDRTLKKAEDMMKRREKGKEAAKDEGKEPAKEPANRFTMNIDFEGLAKRMKRVGIPQSRENGLLWSRDSQALYCNSVPALPSSPDNAGKPPPQGKPALMAISMGDEPRVQKVVEENFRPLAFINGRMVGILDGVPAVLGGNILEKYTFTHTVPWARSKFNAAIFQRCWSALAEGFYDKRMNNVDWRAVYDRYHALALDAGPGELDQVIEMMIGELNSSHQGFQSAERASEMSIKLSPDDQTGHMGLKFDPAWQGPGLKISHIIQGGPADRKDIKLEKDDIILSIDGTPVDPSFDLTRVLNGSVGKELRLKVRSAAGKEHTLDLRPVDYANIRLLVGAEMLQVSRDWVHEHSDNRIGYLHVSRMMWNEFKKFMEDVYEEGNERDALIIDVRNNGGGFTTDYLLTVLTQPQHAVNTVRDRVVDYPLERTVFTPWMKPIILLTNQNSFSNAEVFSHAIRTTKRGRLVGVATAGGVVSTGAVDIWGQAQLRMPLRGWFNSITGEDEELNGARPDFELWPEPQDEAQGRDLQLEKALAMLQEDVKAYLKKESELKLRRAADRRPGEQAPQP